MHYRRIIHSYSMEDDKCQGSCNSINLSHLLYIKGLSWFTFLMFLSNAGALEVITVLGETSPLHSIQSNFLLRLSLSAFNRVLTFPSLRTLVNKIWCYRPGHQKMTHIDNGPGPGRNYGETAVFTICRSVENTQNPSSIWKKVTFFFAQLCPVVARPWFRCKRERFLGGPKIRISA